MKYEDIWENSTTSSFQNTHSKKQNSIVFLQLYVFLTFKASKTLLWICWYFPNQAFRVTVAFKFLVVSKPYSDIMQFNFLHGGIPMPPQHLNNKLELCNQSGLLPCSPAFYTLTRLSCLLALGFTQDLTFFSLCYADCHDYRTLSRGFE